MTLLAWIIVFSLVGGVLSVLAASVFLILPEGVRSQLLPHLISFAIGALLGAAFLALLPHALETASDPHDIGLAVLLGLLTFFLLEKMVLWRHCHSGECETHTLAHGNHAAGTLILIGDGIHNLVDGVLIGAAFLVDIHLGVVTALAVAAHEIPQEVGDFAVLLHSGFSRRKALLYNVLSSFTTLIGALGAWWSLAGIQWVLPYILAVAASSFIYIAVADLIPGLHRKVHLSATLQQFGLITAGVLVIWLAHSTLH